MRYFLFILLFSACAPEKNQKNSPVMTKSELVQVKGLPQTMEQSELVGGAIMYNYPDGERYQVEGELVIAKFNSPQGDEGLIQYWYHRLSKTPHKILKDESSGHYKLSSPAAGIDLIFDPDTGAVIRKISYAPQGV